MPDASLGTLRLLVVRHGETQANAERRYMGQDDSPLTDHGSAQVRAVAERLASWPIDALYSSDLPRAARTAEPVGSILGLPVRYDERLRERRIGVLHGLTVEEARTRCPNVFLEDGEQASCSSIPGGESANDVRDRVAAFVEDLLIDPPGEWILLVAHGGIARGLLWHLLDIPYRAIRWARCDNTSISGFVRKHGMWALERWNDTAHLNAEPGP